MSEVLISKQGMAATPAKRLSARWLAHPQVDVSALMAVTLVLLLAAVVRIHNIDGPALWTDEGFVYYTFKVNLFEALVGDRHPPFYFYTLHAWEGLTGDSILALRWWSMLPSLLTIAVTYQLGRELRHFLPAGAGYGGLGLPVLAALVITLADAENYMAQELRMYTWHVLFAAWSTLAYLRYTRLNQKRELLFYIAAGVLLMYTHYFGAFVLAIHATHVLLTRRTRQGMALMLGLVIIGLIFAPWLGGVTLEQFANEEVRITTEQVNFADVVLDFREKWFGQHWPLTVLLLAAGGYILARERRYGPLMMVTSLILLPIGVSYITGHEEAILLARRLVQITIPISVLIAVGIAAFSVQARAVMAAALLIYGVTTVDWYRIKVPWHEITDLIAQYIQPGELALMEVGFEESALLYYYDHRLPDGVQISSYPVWGDRPRFDYYEVELPALLAEQSQRQTGVVTAWVTFFSPDEGILRKLADAGFIRTFTQPYQHLDSVIDVYRYDLLPVLPVATYENGMILQATETVPDDLRVDLWWSVNTAIDADYTVSAALLNSEGVLVAQVDSQPQLNTRPTTTLQPDEVVYDPRQMVLVNGLDALPPGTYTIVIRVYLFTPEGLLPVLTDAGDEGVVVGEIIR